MALKNIRVDQHRLGELCSRYGVSRLEVMGSFARGDEGPESDLDVLVTFEPGSRVGLEFIALKLDLEALIGRQVDLLTRSSVEHSPNKYLRRYALQRVEPLYERS